MRRFVPVLILSSLGLAAHAETLTLPPNPKPNPNHNLPATASTPAGTPATQSIVLPGRGMTMTDVEEKFGIPLQKFPEVGDPPIIRWVYPDFTVYFEYHYVINAVPNHLAPRPAAPAAGDAATAGDAGTDAAPETPPTPAPAPAAE